MAKMLRFDDHARRALKRGIDQIADAVKATLGPRGRNVVLDRPGGIPVMTNDGVTIARDIELPDPYENIGAQLLREVASKTQDVAGDGTTTATVLAQSIITAGLRAVASGHNPLHLRRGIDRAVAAVVGDIAKHARPVGGLESMIQVASLAAGDGPIGRLVAEALDQVGPDGLVTIEAGRHTENAVRLTRGFQFDRGYISPYFVTDPETMEAVAEGPLVLIHDGKIRDLDPLVPLLREVSEAGRSLLVISEDVEGEALATLVMNRLRGVLEVTAVKAPEFGERRRDILEDLAVSTATEVISEASGRTLEGVVASELGGAERAVVSRDSTTILEGRGDRTAVDTRCAQIRRQLEGASSTYERDKLRERLARMEGRVAVVEIGGFTELDQRARRDRAEDALAATRAALEEGVVPGGGTSYLRAMAALDALRGSNEGESAGIAILRDAVRAPTRILAENAGYEGGEVIAEVLRRKGAVGFNVETGVYEDLVRAGVIDPAKVVRASLQNAASIAGLVLTTDTVVADRPDREGGAGAADSLGAD